MGAWRKSSTLLATSESGRPTALATTDPADLRPMRTGVRTPRTTAPASEIARATALIAALKAGDRA